VLTSCLHTARIHPSRVGGSDISFNSSKENVSITTADSLFLYGEYYSDSAWIDEFNYKSFLINLNLSKTFLDKFKISGILVPFVILNYVDIGFQYELFDVGSDELFKNISSSILITQVLFCKFIQGHHHSCSNSYIFY